MGYQQRDRRHDHDCLWAAATLLSYQRDLPHHPITHDRETHSPRESTRPYLLVCLQVLEAVLRQSLHLSVLSHRTCLDYQTKSFADGSWLPSRLQTPNDENQSTYLLL